ncbi:MAG: hypothetical protein AB7E47_01030 [Desulfovibrionaceae bacterium]
MMLTEKEAKFKHCPYLTTKDDKLRFCLGAMCMMWRRASDGAAGDGDKGYCGLAGKPEGVA